MTDVKTGETFFEAPPPDYIHRTQAPDQGAK
jgi:hypothetical protein